MQLLLQQQHLKNITINLFTDAERLGSCIGAIGEEKEEEKGAEHHVQLGLIDGRWLAEAEQHNNQPPIRIEGESIEVVSRFGEQRTTETQQSAKRE